MGKYMKKSKTSIDIGVIEVSEPTAAAIGVRTRAAKTLALKRLNSSASDSALPADSSRYLQLRSRRLEKPPSLVEPKNSPRGVKVSRVTAASGSAPEANSVIAQDSFESRHSTSESMPCNFMEIIVTPDSSTRLMRTTTTTNKDYTSDMVPTSSELEEFFAYAEKQQQRLFIEKYNFDIVNDMPLTGRYEWVQVLQ